MRKNTLKRKILKILLGGLWAVLLAGIIFFFVYYHVENVEVMASSHYTQEQVREMVLRGPLASNSVLAPVMYSKDDVSDVPFVDGFRVTRLNRNTIAVSVMEKQTVGCIPYLDSYVYFDRNGIFIESSRSRDEEVPYFDGIQVNYILKDEKLPIKGTTVLNTAVALATIFQKNQMIPDHIQFDQNYEISLLYGDINVRLGKDQYLEDKMARAISILPMLEGEKGILHMENITDNVKTVTFEREEVEITAENWPGGYDEDGYYTGYDEYDQNGNYVGPKPKSELDYALEAWVGGYDSELDYTGAGEYDAEGNYVGPAPTQESLDANGDWKGGYTESGGYDGVGEYDREGNYVGPKPEDKESSEEDPSESEENGGSEEDPWESEDKEGSEEGPSDLEGDEDSEES